MADYRQQSEGNHDQADVPVPTVPGTGFIVSEPEFGLGRLERVLDAPTPSFDADQGLDQRAGWAPGREVGPLAIAQAAADQEPLRPRPGLVIGGPIEVGQFTKGPVVQPRALRPMARRQARPGRGSQAIRDRVGGSNHRRLAGPGLERVITLNPEHVTIARPPQRHLDVADPVYGVARHPGKRHAGGKRPFNHRQSQFRLGC